jgi:methylglyoxal synthase
METKSNHNVKKRVAIVAPPDKRKELIEWSYYNKDILSAHELIATSVTAGLLEGTVDGEVYKLSCETIGGYQEMAAMIDDNKVDVIFFFENPMRSFRPDDTIQKLLDIALQKNVLIAGSQSNVDFMKVTA